MRIGSEALAIAWLAAAAPAARAATLVVPDVGGAPVSIGIQSTTERRFAGTVRQRYDFSCGSGALATLLTYQYGLAVTEDEVFREMFARGDQARIRREGFSMLDLRTYLRAHGFQADGFALPLEKLSEARVPAIVLVNEHGYNHFVVVKGLSPGRVLIGDPSAGTRTVARGELDAMWGNRILFVIRNRTELARFNSAKDWDGAPSAPMAEGVGRAGAGPVAIPTLGMKGF